MKKHYCFGYDLIDETRKTPTPYIKYYYTVSNHFLKIFNTIALKDFSKVLSIFL